MIIEHCLIKYFYVQSTPVISKPDITKYPLIAKCYSSPRVVNAFIFIPYNENTVISKEYTGPLDFNITGVDCSYRPRGASIKKLIINAHVRLIPAGRF